MFIQVTYNSSPMLINMHQVIAITVEREYLRIVMCAASSPIMVRFPDEKRAINALDSIVSAVDAGTQDIVFDIRTLQEW